MATPIHLLYIDIHRAQTLAEERGSWVVGVCARRQKKMQREEQRGTKNMRKPDAESLTNHAKSDSKGDPKSSKMTILMGLRGSGGRSGSHVGPQGRPVGPQGRPEAITWPKTTFEGHPGLPIWEVIFGTFRDFSVFFFSLFF